jgi:hypothetical protein
MLTLNCSFFNNLLIFLKAFGFYAFYKGNVPSMHCKMGLGPSMSTGEVRPPPELFLLYLIVLALTTST